MQAISGSKRDFLCLPLMRALTKLDLGEVDALITLFTGKIGSKIECIMYNIYNKTLVFRCQKDAFAEESFRNLERG